MDLEERTVTADGARILLTYKEFELLRLFLSRPGVAFTRNSFYPTFGAWITPGKPGRWICTSKRSGRSWGDYGRDDRNGAAYRLPAGGKGMTKKIFRSILLAAVSVLLASLVIIMGCLYDYYRNVQEKQLRDELPSGLLWSREADGLDYLEQLASPIDSHPQQIFV